MVFYKLCLLDTDGRLEHIVSFYDLSVADAMNRFREWIYSGSHFYRGIMYRCTSSHPCWSVLADDYSWY